MATTEVVTFAFFFELIGPLFLTFVIGLKVLNRYLEFKQKATFYLSLGIFISAISILISSFGRLSALIDGITPSYHGFQYTPFVWIALALAVNAVANIVILLFTNQVFYKGSRRFSLVSILLGGVVITFALILLPTPELIAGEPVQSYIDLFQIFWVLQAFLTFFTGGTIMYASFRDAKKAETLVQKRGFQLTGILGVGLAMVNICFVIDEQLTPYFGGNFSIFYYLGWTFAYIGIIFAYLGFIMPSWLRKHWEK